MADNSKMIVIRFTRKTAILIVTSLLAIAITAVSYVVYVNNFAFEGRWVYFDESRAVETTQLFNDTGIPARLTLQTITTYEGYQETRHLISIRRHDHVEANSVLANAYWDALEISD